ncbi:hypothetical protein QBC42DRAFT_286677 [Cladorrhinum samala]|uniref:Uncharacterized protein n=1 Tax=Cladorrhinum samala TaxID=585594 RepID=A0AAV9HQ97_9PEZI|nr:hypothetical protein QBC42DRAFT_286677 [Cladorrhinum samala]
MSRHSSSNGSDDPYAKGYLTIAKALKRPIQTLTYPDTTTNPSTRNHPSGRPPPQTRTAPIPVPHSNNNPSSGRDPGLYSDTGYRDHHRSPPSAPKDNYPRPRRAVSDSPCSSLDLSFGGSGSGSSSRRHGSDDDARPPPLTRSLPPSPGSSSSSSSSFSPSQASHRKEKGMTASQQWGYFDRSRRAEQRGETVPSGGHSYDRTMESEEGPLEEI